jgi:hypothetical protein
LSIKTQPLLFIGTQRSGSNLLRLILNQSAAIEAPHPPHILQTFLPLLAAYGDLKDEKNFRQLVADITGFIKVNPVPWRNVDLDEERVYSQCNGHSLMEIYRVVYEMKAAHKAARYWSCKSMGNVYYIPEIEKAGLKPYYLYLVRDGRDVAASFKNAIVGEKHMYFIGQKWNEEQRLALEMTAKYAAGRTVIIKYEDFLRHPKSALAPLLKMLDVEWNDDMLEYYKSDEAKFTAAAGDMWKNVIKPIDSGNMRHYSEKLSAEEILIFEQVCSDSLVKLGYALDNKLNGSVANFTTEKIQLYKEQNELMKAEARKEHTLDAHARAAQESFLKGVKSRLGIGPS